MAIEIVDFPIKKGDFPWQNVSSPEGTLDIKLLDLEGHICLVIFVQSVTGMCFVYTYFELFIQ